LPALRDVALPIEPSELIDLPRLPDHSYVSVGRL
jgi:hypothetical protein